MSTAQALVCDWAVTPAKAWHIDRMLPSIREVDRAELWAGWRHTPEQALRYGLSHSSHCWTALVNFEPVLMVGVVPGSLLGGVGVPWLVGTDAMEANQIGFLRRCRPYMRKIRQVYSHLSNHVATDNTVAVRWLEWMGFKIGAPMPMGPEGVMFSEFEWSR